MVSIIIPILNEEKIIASTLQQLKAIEGNFEIIVVDGESGDSSTASARQFSRVIEGTRGRSLQMNEGARAARGNVLLFLHADTVLPVEGIDHIEKCLADSRVVGGRFMVVLDKEGTIYRIIAGLINLRDRLTKGFTGDQAIFIRKDVFDRLGGFRDFPLMEDLDLARRMRRAGKIVRLPFAVTTSARRWEKSGVWRTIVLMWTLRILYLIGVPPKTLKRFYGEVR